MAVLLSLPTEIWRDGILVFLVLKDIARASNALLNHEIQKEFCRLIDGHTTLLPMSLTNPNAEMAKWCISRNVLPNIVSLRGNPDLQIGSLLAKVCSRMTALSLDFCEQIPEPLNCVRLQTLQLYRCNLSVFRNLHGLSNLTSLTISDCSSLTTDSLIERVAECKLLKRCSLKNCIQIGERAVSFIMKQCTFLESFLILGSSFSLAAVLECNFAAPLALCKLELYGGTVCRVGLQKLAVCAPQLHHLQLRTLDNNLQDADVECIAKFFPQLTDLSLSDFTRLNNASMMSIGNGLSQLRTLSVSGCSGISDEGVIAIAKGCLRLESLSIAMCDKVTDTSVQTVWQNCVLLTNLEVHGCTHVTDAAFSCRTNDILRILNVNGTNVRGSFLKQACKLTELYCNECQLLDARFVHGVALGGCHITSLFLNSARLQPSDLMQMSRLLPRIEKIGISNTQADNAVILSLAHNCPRLRWICALACCAITKVTADGIAKVQKIDVTVS